MLFLQVIAITIDATDVQLPILFTILCKGPLSYVIRWYSRPILDIVYVAQYYFYKYKDNIQGTTYSLTHLLTHSLTHSLTDLLTHSLTHLLTHFITQHCCKGSIKLPRWIINSLITTPPIRPIPARYQAVTIAF